MTRTDLHGRAPQRAATLLRRLPALTLLFVSLGFAAPAAAQDEPAEDLTGEWVLTTLTPNGEGRRDVVFQQDGNTLTGTIASSMAEGPLEGIIDGEVVIFTAFISMDTADFEIVYEATLVDGELVDGTLQIGDYGSGTFTGRRKEAGEG